MLSDLLKRTLAELARDHAGPCLVYDADSVAARVRAAKAAAAPHGCDLLFAVKASPDESFIRLMLREDVGFDVANGGEIAQVESAAADTGKRPAFLSLTGPAIGEAWRQAPVDVVNVDGTYQWEGLADYRGVIGARVMLPEIGEEPEQRWNSRFGLRPDSPGFDRIRADRRFGALHHHRPGPRTAEDLLRSGATLMRMALPHSLRYLNLGGAIEQLSLDEIALVLAALRRFVPPETRLLLEPGSFWFAGAGYALCKVVSVEPLASEVHRIVVDLSQDLHLEWSKACLLAANGLPPGRVLVVGPTCHEADVIGAFEIPAAADPDGLPCGHLLLGGVEGYSAAWNSAFNGIGLARVVIHGDA